MQAKSQNHSIAFKGKRYASIWDVVQSRPLTQFIQHKEHSEKITDDLAIQVNNNEILSAMAPMNSHVIVTRMDNNCSARAIMFGVLISANIAIRNKTDNASDMQATLTILLNAALQLQALYQNGEGKLVIQSKAFPGLSNTVVKLIQGVMDGTVTTTELVCLVNTDYNSNMANPLHLALTDLCHYLLYLESMQFIQKLSAVNKEEDNVRIIRDNGDRTTRRMTDLLRTEMLYTDFESQLVCDHLKIDSQNINLDADITDNSFFDRPTSFITVTGNNHTTLLLDQITLKDIISDIEKSTRVNNLEVTCRADGVAYYPKPTPEESLHAMEDDFIRLCNQATMELDQTNFLRTFQHVCDLFLRTVRPYTWDIKKYDNLLELEDVLYHWQLKAALNTSSETLGKKKRVGAEIKHEFVKRRVEAKAFNKDILENNIKLVDGFLQKIYLGDVSPLLTEPTAMHVRFCIGGADNALQSGLVDLGSFDLQPAEYQRFMVLIAGINKTNIYVGSPNDKYPLDALLVYIKYMMQSPSMQTAQKQIVKQTMTRFFQDVLDHMPQHKMSILDPGFPAYQDEVTLLNATYIRFQTMLHRVHLTDPVEYQPLTIKQPVDETSTPIVHHSVLPPKLSDFEGSINPIEYCRQAWVLRFTDYEKDTPALSHYFSGIRDEVGDASNEVRRRFSLKLSAFVTQLEERHSNLFGIHMMRELALYSSSPRPALDAVSVGSQKVVEKSKNVTFQIVSPKCDETVTLGHDEPVALEPDDTAAVVQEDTLLLVPNDSVLRDDSLNEQLKALIIAKIASDRAFNKKFDQFHNKIKKYIEDFPHQAGGMLRHAMDTVSATHESLRNDNFLKIEPYLLRISNRLVRPIPVAQEAELARLKAKYANRWTNGRKTLKLAFLEELEATILNNLTETYQQCIDSVLRDPITNFNVLFSNPGTFSHYFFSTHDLGNLLRDLRALDPPDASFWMSVPNVGKLDRLGRSTQHLI